MAAVLGATLTVGIPAPWLPWPWALVPLGWEGARVVGGPGYVAWLGSLIVVMWAVHQAMPPKPVKETA